MKKRNQRKTGWNKQQTQRQIKKIYNRQKSLLDLSKCLRNWQKILKYENLPIVLELDFLWCKVNDMNIDAFTYKPWITLQKLWLEQNSFTYLGVKKLLINDSFINLKSLELNWNNIGSRGIKLLVKMNLPQLNLISLSDCQVQNVGAQHLVKSKWFKLKQINLQFNYININGYNQMATFAQWELLNQLALRASWELNLYIGFITFSTMKSKEAQFIFKNTFSDQKYIQNQNITESVMNVLNQKITQKEN